ncbi:MAG: hypothetical protein KDD06_19600 [Phaeodactylibacter sp.]|nr:hypothetical protein [Phaeodactylibacter sp.]MCB9264397.1 hypothetical protein [Lewinellaceae bacterium]MCB9286014.1 hypothetical protein [Lewinellaceae bacterium]
MRKTLPFLALILLACLFFAFRKQEVFVVVSGKVAYQGQGLESVQVAVVKDKNDNLDWSLMSKYTEPTSTDGSFRLRFNVVEGEPAFIYFMKPGYSILKKHIITSGKEKEIALGTNSLINMRRASQLSQYQQSPSAVRISNNQNALYGRKICIFDNKDFRSSLLSLSQDEIKYFSKIKRRSRDEYRLDSDTGEHVRLGGYWYEVAYVTASGAQRNGWIFSD